MSTVEEGHRSREVRIDTGLEEKHSCDQDNPVSVGSTGIKLI